MSYSLTFSKAIITIVFVADKVEQGMYDFVPTKKISESLNLAGPTAVKILHNLVRSGLIETREGSKGGIRLAKRPSDITILDIFNAIEYERPMFRLELNVNVKGEKPTKAQLAINDILTNAENKMKDSLNKITIADLLKRLY